MASVMTRQLADLAEATPQKRDRYVDLLRALSIAVVVFGHWLMAIVYMDGGRITGTSALDEVSGIWALTWVLQVMPLFFMVGGFSNLVSWRAAETRGDGYGAFVRGRIERLMRPTAVFVGVWLATSFVLDSVFGVGASIVHATGLLAKPVWFLAVYVLVVALAPMMVKLHERFRLRVLVVLAGAAVVVDIVRIGAGLELVGYLNFAFVWLFVHQVGFFYADGTLTAKSRKFHGAVAGAGIVALTVLTNIGVYSRAMVGTKSHLASNNDPPSICLIALTMFLLGAVMLARPAATRFLEGRTAWTAVIAANSMIMTVFLWHLTAMLVAVAIMYPLGFPQPVGGTVDWWATRPLWLAMLTVSLVPFVVVFGRFERPRAQRDEAPVGPAASVAAIALLVVGMGGFAEGGFADVFSPVGVELGIFTVNPLLSGLHMAVGLVVFKRPALQPVAALVLMALVALEVVAGNGTPFPATAPNLTFHAACATALFLRPSTRRRSLDGTR